MAVDKLDASQRRLLTQDLRPLLEVARHLASPFDLMTMLAEVVSAAMQVLRADGGSVWLYDPQADELVLQIGTGMEPVRVSADKGLVGSCARTRQVINVPDCYADPRFNQELDRSSSFRTRCMLTLPLIDHKDTLVGVLQVLNKSDGIFDETDEVLATALAAQCAVALQRVRMTDALIEGEKMRQELETARVVQMSTLPASMPSTPAYEVFGASTPADMTGGDTYDLAMLGENVLIVLGDATGHGLAPALHVTQMHAMLRMAFRLGADLDTAYFQLNNQLSDILPDDRFITAFIGVLDTATHTMHYHSGGQAPILHYVALDKSWRQYGPTCFPLAAMPLTQSRQAVSLAIGEGDILVLLSDGIYEYHDLNGEMFGEQRVMDLIMANLHLPLSDLADSLMAAVNNFAAGAPQEDDITIVFMKRTPGSTPAHQAFQRKIDSLQEIFAFTARVADKFQIDPSLLGVIDFTIEELFTNMVKYSKMSVADVDIELARISRGIEVKLTDHDVDPFDVTQAPDVDISRPIEQRVPGGLGLHLIRRLVDNIEYHYDPVTRESVTRFSKTVSDHATDAPN